MIEFHGVLISIVGVRRAYVRIVLTVHTVLTVAVCPFHSITSYSSRMKRTDHYDSTNSYETVSPKRSKSAWEYSFRIPLPRTRAVRRSHYFARDLRLATMGIAHFDHGRNWGLPYYIPSIC
jgi:hypothetical protein